MCWHHLLLAAGVASLLPAAEPNRKAPAPQQPPPTTNRARMSSAAQRNENVPLYLIDNNAIKESYIRLGDEVTVITEQPVEASYYAAEHGRPASGVLLLPKGRKFDAWHGEAFWMHQNSVFNARTFFQVGPVLPSHRNSYGGRFTGAVRGLGSLTGSFGQRDIRGMVNGNVLVPLPGERTPLATDPATRAMVSRFLEAYPKALPNRPDFDPRMLNTNSPQRIDETDGSLRLDRQVRSKGAVALLYSLSRQRVDAFQFVAGQNPDTTIHSHNARASYRYAHSPSTELAIGFQFQRTRSDLVSEPNAVGPRIRIGFQIEELGPDSHFPIQRAQNSYRSGLVGSRIMDGGRHVLTFGGDYYRLQLNGIESSNQRGFFSFTNNFGRSAIQNFLMGIPTTYEASIGHLARGFRQSLGNAFFGDKFQIHPRLQLYYGVRFSPDGSPYEVNGLTPIPYGCDCNNVAPRFSLAWRAPADWLVRASYNLSYGTVVPVAYQQARNNLPLVKSVMIQDPNLTDPLKGFQLDDPNLRVSPLWLNENLRAAYSHQYNLQLERKLPWQANLRLSYVGSRTIQLLNNYILNRGEVIPGIPLTTSTVDQRRADQRYYDIRWVINGGIGYMDAGQVSYDLPLRRGLMISTRYTFSKAIDDGSDYSYTGANTDLQKGRSQTQYNSLQDRRGLSLFDARHAFSFAYSYDLPRWNDAPRAMRWIAHGWQFSGVTTLKSGTPLTLFVGSDAPGFGNVDGGPADRPNILDPSILGKTISHPNTAPDILRRERFAFIVPGEARGSIGKGTLRKARIGNWNAGLSKEWHANGGREFGAIFRVEAYNLTNTPQFDEPQRNLSSPSFGRITNTLNDGRVFQIGLRLIL